MDSMFSSLSISDIITIIVSLLIAMACHEFMHAYVAHKLGDRLAYEEGRVSLNPLRHIDIFTTILLPFVMIIFGAPPIFAAKPVPFNAAEVKYGEYGIAIVGVVGPLTNLGLAILASLVLHIGGIATGLPVYQAITTFMAVNIGLFVFNMIPLPPLDGSRLLYAFAPDPLRRVMEQIEAFGFMALLLVLLLLFQFIGPIVNNISSEIFTLLLR